MTPAELKEARRNLGLTQSELAAALGLADGDTVRQYESGRRPISGPVAVAVTYMVQYGPLDAPPRSEGRET